MATRRYKVSPGMTEFQVIEEAGIAVVSNVVELTIDLGNDVSDSSVSGGIRPIRKQEILDALEKITNHIVSYPSPTAQ